MFSVFLLHYLYRDLPSHMSGEKNSIWGIPKFHRGRVAHVFISQPYSNSYNLFVERFFPLLSLISGQNAPLCDDPSLSNGVRKVSLIMYPPSNNSALKCLVRETSPYHQSGQNHHLSDPLPIQRGKDGVCIDHRYAYTQSWCRCIL